jgi:hypothetical protein
MDSYINSRSFPIFARQLLYPLAEAEVSTLSLSFILLTLCSAGAAPLVTRLQSPTASPTDSKLGWSLARKDTKEMPGRRRRFGACFGVDCPTAGRLFRSILSHEVECITIGIFKGSC